MSGNLGQTSLRRKRRGGKAMEIYDRLPRELRLWLADAALPWSPTSALRIWSKSRAKGLSAEETLSSLARAEAQTLARDKAALRAG